MKEAQIFESWINNLVEGTWSLPETPEQKQELIDLMSKDFPVGPDATNATEQLYNVFGDDQLFDALQELADADANADARSVVMTRMQELSDRSPDLEVVLGQLQTTSPVQPTTPEPDQMATDVAGDEQLPQSVEEEGVAEGSINEGQMSEADAVIQDIINGDADVYDIMTRPTTPAERYVSNIIEKYYETVSIDSGLHPDDNFEEILDRVVERLADDYGHQGVEEGQCNMTEAGEYCPKHGLEECGIYEYTGNWTNFGLEESDALSQLKRLALGK